MEQLSSGDADFLNLATSYVCALSRTREATTLVCDCMQHLACGSWWPWMLLLSAAAMTTCKGHVMSAPGFNPMIPDKILFFYVPMSPNLYVISQGHQSIFYRCHVHLMVLHAWCKGSPLGISKRFPPRWRLGFPPRWGNGLCLNPKSFCDGRRRVVGSTRTLRSAALRELPSPANKRELGEQRKQARGRPKP